ncbi:hypothetical protein KM043_007469 [Ampulex compressa]|nr:hypothetical protein KM043_007469 [Ampulex compressa]
MEIYRKSEAKEKELDLSSRSSLSMSEYEETRGLTDAARGARIGIEERNEQSAAPAKERAVPRRPGRRRRPSLPVKVGSLALGFEGPCPTRRERHETPPGKPSRPK